MASPKNKILIFGGTGYLGKFMVKASVPQGHPTFVYVRPINPHDAHPSNSNKLQLHTQFQSMGILKAIKEAKEAGNIKGKQRFVPSEYGNEVDRVSGLPPFEALLENKRKIRRATEAAGISYTYVSANAFAAYFIEYLLHPHDQSAPNEHQVKVYGSGHTKAPIILGL
ncbi:hypothetical protein F8388_018801 [Cannabis sativa]|uniref:NmrA-like domain-containing protein n=1 Tax=Cannabis sativa TaxID=3483 RepID=A0A7J6FGA9_CANSA|nr:hypothetical protein F8388_018801 [Cannabis sativa]